MLTDLAELEVFSDHIHPYFAHANSEALVRVRR